MSFLLFVVAAFLSFVTVLGVLPPDTPQWVVGLAGVAIGVVTMAVVAFARSRADTVESDARATADTSDDAPAAAQAAAWRALADALARGDVFGASVAAMQVWPTHKACGSPPVPTPPAAPARTP